MATLLDGFSLPTQRCFYLQGFPFSCFTLFSAYAEVFLVSNTLSTEQAPFLCLRRGVSAIVICTYTAMGFSLPTQRCFSDYDPDRRCCSLFSAYAEVFLSPRRSRPQSLPFLCLRRGVSGVIDRPKKKGALFSAYAEVFLAEPAFACNTETFLCLRRGVSRSAGMCTLATSFSLPTQRCFPK